VVRGNQVFLEDQVDHKAQEVQESTLEVEVVVVEVEVVDNRLGRVGDKALDMVNKVVGEEEEVEVAVDERVLPR